MEFTDRYQALGIPYPDPATMCKGHCEGTGYVPVSQGDTRGGLQAVEPERPELVAAWKKQHAFTCGAMGRIRNVLMGIVTFDQFRIRLGIEQCDGWHFVKCPDCSGTGKQRGE